MENLAFYDYLLKVASIAKIGLLYSTDPYALANYRDLQILTTQMLENFVDVKFDRPNFFGRDIYPTPSVSVRTVIFDDKKRVLLVREAKDEMFSLPGGWADLYESPKEAAIKECIQEAGAVVEIVRLVAVLNRTPFKKPTSVPEYALVFEGKLLKPLGEHEYETTEVGYFDLDHLPPFSHKVSTEEMLRMIHATLNGETIIE